MKKYRWFAHYNKPLSKQKKKVMWSLHYRGKCYFTEGIHFITDSIISTKVNKRQPYATIQGFAHTIYVGKKSIVVVESKNHELIENSVFS